MLYPDWLKELLRCPVTGAELKFENNAFKRLDGKIYFVYNDMASMVHPAEVGGGDARMNKLYNFLAPFYDFNERFFGRIFTGVDIAKGRKEIVSLLDLQPGMRILEVSPGPGVFQPHLREAVGSDGEILALDLSMGMLRQCQNKNSDLNIYLIHANAQHLPFADESFDAVFHFGGINLFNDPQQAIDEFVRVVKKNGLVAWGDEGFSKNYPNNFRKKLMSKINPGFLKDRPRIPSGLFDVKEYEVYNGMAYLHVAKKQ